MITNGQENTLTGRRISAAAAGALAAFGVWVYVANLRYERSFYRRFLIEKGRDPET